MQTVKIIVCGDFRAARPEIIQMSKDVKDLFRNSSLAICNFEAPVHTDGVKPSKKSGPSLDQSIDSPAKVKEMGFNVILMANNHIMDYGVDGLKATINSFDDVTIVGAGISEDAFKVKFIDIDGRKIGLLSFVQREFGTIESIDDAGVGAAWVNSLDVPGIIMQSKKECDVLLLFPHAGVEHTAAPLPEWRRLYKKMIEWGADAVIASHPHCPQGWEIYKGKFIFYSLGNFYFDEISYDDLWYKSILVELSISETIVVKVHYLCFDDNTGQIEVDSSERMCKYVKYANRLLKNEQEYNDYLNEMCARRWIGIKYLLLRGVCGVSLRMKISFFLRLLGCMLLGNTAEMYLLNIFQCESHRWVVERYLKNKK